MKSKYRPEMVAKVKELGKRNYAVTEAAELLGISPSTFRLYERTKLPFHKASARVRRNTEEWKAWRFHKLCQKHEFELLRALAVVRERKDKARLAAEEDVRKANLVCEQRGAARAIREEGECATQIEVISKRFE